MSCYALVALLISENITLITVLTQPFLEEHSLTTGNLSHVISLPFPHLHCTMFYFGSHKQSSSLGTCVEENPGDDNRTNVHVSWMEGRYLIAIITTNVVQCLWTTDNALGVMRV